MNIEYEIFKGCSVYKSKLLSYGFKKNKDNYILERKFLNDFKAVIIIDKDENVSGKVIDLQINEEYTNFRTNMTGEFASNVREEYKNFLIDIKNNCFKSNYFLYKQSNRISKYIKKEYNTNPEFLWKKYPQYGVFRNNKNKKWFAIIMNLDLSKLTNKSGNVEIINVKLDENYIKQLLDINGFYMAYHMSKKDWISIILNDTLDDELIKSLIDKSYNLVNDMI